MKTGAQFSECGLYRYHLWRRWDEGKTVLWVMLNPSTADDIRNDPTVERCQRRAMASGTFGAVEVVNIFALRSTDPKGLRRDKDGNPVEDPIGPDNDYHIISAAARADVIICGWGNDGAYRDRGHQVAIMLAKAGFITHALRITKQRQPQHPLYVGYAVQPRVWVEPGRRPL